MIGKINDRYHSSTETNIRRRHNSKQTTNEQPEVITIENQKYNIKYIRRTMMSKSDRIRNKQNQANRKSTQLTLQTHSDEPEDLYKFVGDGEQKKQANTLRLYYNNCNGLEATKLAKSKIAQKRLKEEKQFLGRTVGNSKIERMLATLKQWKSDIICLSETNVAWDKPIARQIYNLVKVPFAKEACWITSASNMNNVSLIKPGGTAMLVDVSFTGSIIEKGQDWTSMGRWSYVKLRGRNDRVINIITGYRCNKVTTSTGDMTAWTQQYAISRERGMATPNPHMNFLQDLEKWITPKIIDGEDILLTLDANEEWRPGTSIKLFASKLGLYNIAEHTHDNLPPSRPKSMKTIDFILGTERVLDSVKNLSMVPYDLENLGDHRGVMIDFDTKTLFGHETNHSVNMQQRKLVTSDANACEQYLDKLERKFVYHKIFERTEKLVQDMREKGTATNFLIQQYEAIYTDIYRACRFAESKCKKLGNKDYYWSPTLAQAIEIQRYWKMRLSRAYTGAPPTSQMEKYKKKYGIEDDFVDLTCIKEKSIEATNHLKKVQDKAIEYRVEFLQRQAQKYADHNNIPVEKAIRAILSYEEDREVWKKIKIKLKKFSKSQLDKIWIDAKRGHSTTKKRNRIEINSTEEIHNKLLARNRRHLNQASVTPFTHGTLSEMIGVDGSTNHCDDIIKGTWEPPENCEEIIRTYVSALKIDKNTAIEGLKTDITKEDFYEFWSKKRESTATSPMGLHVGHYKVSLENEDIAEVHRTMMLLPFQFGFAPKRWCSSVQLMLQKDPGQPWIHRLRIIELLDASFNGALMILIGRKMVYHAKDQKCIHPSNYGSVPGKTAQGAILQKKLSIDIIKQRRESGAVFECDATGCYDRILPSLQTLHTRRIGLAKNAAITMSKSLTAMKRYVATKFGQSKKFIRTNKGMVLYGIGQGSGGGPGVWLTHSTVLFNILDAKGIIPHFSSVDMSVECKSGGTGFVDDVSLIVQSKHNSTNVTELMKTLKHNAQTWEQMLHVSGGKLELIKCFWGMVLWKWIAGHPTLVKIAQVPAKLKLNQTEHKKKKLMTIQRIESDEANKVLGVRVSIDGTWKVEFTNWVAKGRSFANAVRMAKFNRTCGLKIFQFIWTAKVRYPMSIIGFSKRQCKRIESPVVSACLSAAGLCRTFPRAVVYAPVHLGGLGWLSMQTIQAQEMVTITLKHVKMNDTVGKLILISLQLAQVTAGISKPLLEPEALLPEYIGTSWIYSLHKMLWENSMKLRINKCWTVVLCRENDIAIMDHWVKQHDKKKLQQLNMCRLYLKVNTLADMCDISGTRILESVWEVKRPPRPSSLNWPQQIRPPRSAIRLWQEALQDFSNSDMLLLTPLGRWSKKNHQEWNYFQNRQISFDTEIHNRDKGTIIRNISDYIKQDAKQVQKVLGQSIFNNRVLENIRTDWNKGLRLTTATDGGLKRPIGSHGYVIFLRSTTMEDEFIPKEYTENTINQLLSRSIVYGYGAEATGITKATSTREELFGILSIFYILRACQVIYGIPSKVIKMEMIVDSKAALLIRNRKNSDCYDHDKFVLDPDMDIEGEICHVENQLTNVDITYKWTKSHVDMNEQGTSRMSVLNMLADHLATIGREKSIAKTIIPAKHDVFPSQRIALKLSNDIIHNDFRKVIHEWCTKRHLIEYLSNKFEWSTKTYDLVAWDEFGTVVNEYPADRKIGLLKLLYGWQHTNVMRCRHMIPSRNPDPMTPRDGHRKKQDTIEQGRNGVAPVDITVEGNIPSQYNDVDQNAMTPAPITDKCTACGEIESKFHMFRCQSNKMRNVRQIGWKNLAKSMRRYTHDTILHHMYLGLHSVTESHIFEEGPIYSEMERLLKNCNVEQTEIGWINVFFGRISKQWGKVNASMMKAVGRTAIDPSRWTTRFIREILKITEGIWIERNIEHHGGSNAISLSERDATAKIIQSYYEKLKPLVLPQDQWLFQKSVRRKLSEPYCNRIAWIETISKIYKKEISELDLVTNVRKYTYEVRC